MNDMTDTTESAEVKAMNKVVYVAMVAGLIGGAAAVGYGAGRVIGRGINWVSDRRESKSV